MNPLSPLTYYWRHKRHTLLLLTLIALMTLGISVMVRLPDSFLEHMAYSEGYVTRTSLVSAIGATLDPGIVAQIRTHPGVAQAMQMKGLFITWPPISGDSLLLAASESDVQYLLDSYGLRLKDGRLPQPHTNEMVLAESMAKGAKLSIGDEVSRAANDDWFAAIPSPLVVVGILGPDGSIAQQSPPVAIASYEYVSNHEGFSMPWAPGLLVVAKQGHQAAVEDFLETTAKSYAEVRTGRALEARLARLTRNFHLLFGVVNVLVATAVALVVGMINRISLSRRLAEMGVLHAVGHSRSGLVRRLALETTLTATVGWVLGLAASWGCFVLLGNWFYEPNGLNLSLATLTPVWFSLPVPLATVAFVIWNASRTLRRLDAVAVIERDQLSTEVRQAQAAKRSTRSPLSAGTFYLRHRRRGVALVVTMGLMILGVAFPAFVFGPMMDAWRRLFEHLRQVTVVSPRIESTVDPAVSSQIRDHANVAGVVRAKKLRIRVDVPPMAHPSIPLYAVSEVDLETLVDLYGARIVEGRLPRPRSNEIVLSEALAQNRGWRVGDRVGRAHGSKADDELPTEMVVVGILSCPGQDDLWTGFVSLEYMDSHEFYAGHATHLLVLPQNGRKGKVDTWLEENVASGDTAVQTYDQMQTDYGLAMWAMMALFGIIEGVIGVVAAIALAILSYTFFIQRRDEFGVLHAIGHSLRRLVRRTAWESISTVAVAWLLSVVLCAIGLVYVQARVFAPKGMTFNLLHPAPYLSTLPLPLAVVVVGVGLVARMLRRLDPVTVIEGRTT